MKRNRIVWLCFCLAILCCILLAVGFSKQKMDFDAVLVSEQEQYPIDVSLHVRRMDLLFLRRLHCDITFKQSDGTSRDLPINGIVYDMEKYGGGQFYQVFYLVYSISENAFVSCNLYFDKGFENWVLSTETNQIIAASPEFCRMIEK